MSAPLFWLVATGLLAALQWVPYIAERALLWGPAVFLNNYPPGFPAQEPEPALWAQRSRRAHLNLLENLPGFAVVVLAGEVSGAAPSTAGVAAAVFFFARVAYAAVYTLGIPFLRTPVYLVSWAAILYLGLSLFTG